MDARRVLFVDDEDGIRETLPAILQTHGYKVTAVATVAEALGRITSEKFDVLISDLNIGAPGDGFTVVSAMRRTQPNCVNLIITGYPALESALKAIRQQVDDYLVKPAHPTALLAAIELRLREHAAPAGIGSKRVSAVIREHADAIGQRAVLAMKKHPVLGAMRLTDEKRLGAMPDVLRHVADIIDDGALGEITAEMQRVGRLRAQARKAQGYSVPMLIESVRILQDAIHDVLAENLLSVELSYAFRDLRCLNDGLLLELEATVAAYMEADEQVA